MVMIFFLSLIAGHSQPFWIEKSTYLVNDNYTSLVLRIDSCLGEWLILL
jgi:hypothetical protein